MSVSQNYLVGFVLAVSLLVAANVKAEYVVLESSFEYFQTAVDPGYGGSVKVTAQQSADGKGVTFTFISDYEGIMQIQSKGNGAGILIYTANDADKVFDYSGMGTASLNQLAQPYNGVSAYQTQMDAGAAMQGSSWLFDNSLTLTLNFADGMNWEHFVENMEDFAIGLHLAPKDISSSMYIAGDWKNPTEEPPPSPPPVSIPEPTTLTVLGLGLAGLGGWAAARRRKTKEQPERK